MKSFILTFMLMATGAKPARVPLQVPTTFTAFHAAPLTLPVQPRSAQPPLVSSAPATSPIAAPAPTPFKTCHNPHYHPGTASTIVAFSWSGRSGNTLPQLQQQGLAGARFQFTRSSPPPLSCSNGRTRC
jgi:hypothetical protein